MTLEQRLYRDALLMELAYLKDIDLVGESSSGKDTLKYLALTKPTSLIIEENLQDMDGLTIAEIALSKHPSLSIVLLVDQDIPKQRLAIYLDSGIKSVVSKQQSMIDLVQALNYTRNGQVYVDVGRFRPLQKSTNHLMEGIDSINVETFLSLSEREQEVAKYIAEHMPVKQIAITLGLSDKTVHTYKERILIKLGFERLPELIVFMKRLKFQLALEKALS